MPAEVKILVEGYTNANEVGETGQEKTQPTVTLVKDGDIVMVVDPGILESQEILVDALEKENLTVDDINIVCVTHSHIDHFRNVGMFAKAKILEGYGLWDKNTVEEWFEDFSTNIKVLHTPGHDHTGITLFVTTAPESEYPGVVAICGDIFWKENYPQDPKDDTFAANPEVLKTSRKTVLEMADWIIPGHGPIYKNDKNKELDTEEIAEPKREERKIVIVCKRCGRQMKQNDRCQCRPYLCYHCCECGLDCNYCSCSHKR